MGNPVQINITVDAKAVTDGLTDLAQRQVPFIVSKFLNDIASDGKRLIQSRLPQVFDRPTAFTTKGVFVKAATKAKPEALIFFPDSSEASGKDAREYIRPGANGSGARHQKKTEYLLTRMGYLPAGWITVPGKGMPLDGYGNMSGAYYKQIIRNLGIKVTKGPPKPASMRSQKRAVRMSVASEFFAIAPGSNKLGKHGGNLPAGVYRRSGRHGEILQQYLRFASKAAYKQRLNLDLEGQHLIASSGQTRWDDAMQLAINTITAR